jgi:major membrane immunogen (membrane-anchored lipoprotein)
MSIKNKYIGILLTATMMLLSACSSDDPEAQTVTTGEEPVGKVVQLVSYASPFTDKELSHRAAPAGFSAYTPDKTTSMGIYTLLSEDWANPKEEKIIYNNNKWHAFFEVTADKTYTVYGYMPKTGEMESSLTSITADAATLTISNMKPVTTDDICIITGVKDTDSGLKEGQFSWSTPMEEVETYKISLLMDHLYAAAQFRLKIDAEYANLRTIKLKTMTLSTNKGSVNATVTLTHNTTGASPISNVDFAPSGSSDAVLVFNSDTGTALDKDTPVDINACFAPTLSDKLTMVTTYDVYDRKGNLIRENSTATNKLPNLAAVRGQKVQVNLTVNPTYLYVLSEPDLDNPTIKIEN